ncbi:MAG: alkane 1-monooxygenase, partial [Gallionella sp.]
DKPYVMLGYNVFAADTEEEAQLLATSMQQAFVNLRSGYPKRLQPPVQGYLDTIPPHFRDMVDEVLSCSAIGSADTVKHSLQEFIAQTGADELMIASMIFDHDARLRSYQIAAEIRAALG